MIVQIREPLQDGSDPNFSLTSFVADQLDKDGRVRPVVWSLTDPVFRQWTSRDVFGAFEQNPEQSHAVDTARKLGVKYVLIVRGFREDQKMYAMAELFSNGRSVWRFGPRKSDRKLDIEIQTDGKYDEKATRALQSKMPELLKAGGTFTVYRGGIIDPVETARSVASTWTALLADGPFKDLAQKPRIDNGDSGNTGELEPTDLDGPEGSSAEDVVAAAKALLDNGKFHQALLLLREACDRRPFDASVRKLLVDTLILAGMASEAADAAQAATRLSPKEISSWILAARSWVYASDPGKAAEALEEARKLGAAPADLQETEGDLALLNGDATLAISKFAGLEAGRSTLRKAVAMALTGNTSGCIATLQSLGDGPLSEEDYRTAILFIERSLLTLSDSSRSILPTIRLHPGAPETLSQAKSLSQLATGLSELVSHLRAPQIHSESHESRKLAHILLAQAAMEALDFAERNDPDIGEEAAATFGQAFKLFPGVREKFALERKYGGAQ